MVDEEAGEGSSGGGLPPPHFELPTMCPGCGVGLQSEDKNLPGEAQAVQVEQHISSTPR